MRRLLLALALAGCAPAAPLAGTWTLAPGERLVTGQVRLWRQGTFSAVDASVSAAKGTRTTAAWAATGFALPVLAEEVVSAVAPGAIGVAQRVRPGASGVVLPLAELKPADGGCWVVGVVCAEDGAALGGAMVHGVDSAGGNRQWRADAQGCFAQAFPALAGGGAVSLMAYGTLPDGRASEGRTVRAVAVPGPGAVVVALETGP